MSESRISELKNKVMKVHEDALTETKKLLEVLAPRLENKISREMHL